MRPCDSPCVHYSKHDERRSHKEWPSIGVESHCWIRFAISCSLSLYAGPQGVGATESEDVGATESEDASANDGDELIFLANRAIEQANHAKEQARRAKARAEAEREYALDLAGRMEQESIALRNLTEDLRARLGAFEDWWREMDSWSVWRRLYWAVFRPRNRDHNRGA